MSRAKVSNIDTMKKKKVLFITSTMKIGGAEKIIADLIMGLSQRGYQSVLVCIKTLDFWGEYLRKNGIECHELGVSRQWNIIKISKLMALAARIQPEIIYSLDHRDAIFWSRLLAFFLGCPHILSQHSLRLAGAEAPNRIAYKFMIKTTTPLSSKIVVCSNAVRDYFLRIGIPDKKIKVIHNGVSIYNQIESRDSVEWRSSLRIPFNSKLVGIVAALRPIKDHETFLKSAQRVIDRYSQTYFAIIGDGYLRPDLEKLARLLGISKNVFFLGNITPADGIIKSLDIGVLSSQKEAFPMVILEYMNAGLPVVSTDCGGPSEIIQDGETGFIVPVNNPQAMAEKIICLLENQKDARYMGLKGRQKVMSHYSLEKMINRNIALFDQLGS
jgi:glycosyltransferase involved in cell wall biosynthesis